MSVGSGNADPKIGTGGCGSCKHWSQDQPYHAQGAIEHWGWGVCELPEFLHSTSTYDYEKKEIIAPPSAGAGVMDGSGYWAALLTAPDFWCREYVSVKPLRQEEKA